MCVFLCCLQLIHKGTKLVLEQVVTSIASVADTAEEKFVPYYDQFMPSLKDIVEKAVQKELRLLRGKTIECISLIGLAVGKEKVRPIKRCKLQKKKWNVPELLLSVKSLNGGKDLKSSDLGQFTPTMCSFYGSLGQCACLTNYQSFVEISAEVGD